MSPINSLLGGKTGFGAALIIASKASRSFSVLSISRHLQLSHAASHIALFGFNGTRTNPLDAFLFGFMSAFSRSATKRLFQPLLRKGWRELVAPLAMICKRHPVLIAGVSGQVGAQPCAPVAIAVETAGCSKLYKFHHSSVCRPTLWSTRPSLRSVALPPALAGIGKQSADKPNVIERIFENAMRFFQSFD